MDNRGGGVTHLMPGKADSTVVYIVDDDEAVRCALSRLMRSAGHQPIAYESAERFLGAVYNQPSACILLDITLPGMTGLQVQAALADMDIHIPVIVLSARDDDETRQRARDLGAHFFLHKPVDDHALLDAVAWVVDAKRRK